MAYTLKENQLSIFKNKYKKEEKHPDYKGEINVNGVLMDIALWVKESENGKFFSGKISEKQEKVIHGPEPDMKKKVDAKEIESDDLPF